MDVLHVFEAPGQGGAEQNLLSLLRHLPASRFRHHLAWVLPAPMDLLDQFRPLVATLLPLNGGGPLWVPGAIVKLARWLRRHRPDIIHAQMVRPQIIARLAAFWSHTPVVTTWQNPYYDDAALAEFANSRLRRLVLRLLDRASGRRDRHFIAVSKSVAESCGKNLGVSPDRVSVIHNSLDPGRYIEAQPAVLDRVRVELSLDSDRPVLLTVGRLTPQKAHLHLIAAMPLVLRQHPRAVLLIAGRGSLESAMRKQIASLGVVDAVQILGQRKDVCSLYQIADLFVFPSRYEGLSVALVEALANGLPAVLSDIPPNREVVDDQSAVRFVPPGDPAALADAICEMLASRDLMRVSARRLSHSVRISFSPELLADRFGWTLERAIFG